jgi:hypothetical protein
MGWLEDWPLLTFGSVPKEAIKIVRITLKNADDMTDLLLGVPFGICGLICLALSFALKVRRTPDPLRSSPSHLRDLSLSRQK